MRKNLISIVSAMAGATMGGIIATGVVANISCKETAKVQKMSDKHLELFKMMNQWVRVKQEEKNLSDFFEKKGYKKIAIYGMSYAGETLVNELRETNIQVLYGIDQLAERLYAEIDIVTLDDDLKEVDAIVVTAITFFNEIEEMLSKKLNCPIISLEDILYDI